uniref:Alginate lyase AlyVMI n=1 Tax=Vibrio halioticoli TaxID=71388 RepID=Q9RGQ4_9VIBR|nr:alginate lyase AlyVMI [Vibrio halioticoli]
MFCSLILNISALSLKRVNVISNLPFSLNVACTNTSTHSSVMSDQSVSMEVFIKPCAVTVFIKACTISHLQLITCTVFLSPRERNNRLIVITIGVVVTFVTGFYLKKMAKLTRKLKLAAYFKFPAILKCLTLKRQCFLWGIYRRSLFRYVVYHLHLCLYLGHHLGELKRQNGYQLSYRYLQEYGQHFDDCQHIGLEIQLTLRRRHFQ